MNVFENNPALKYQGIQFHKITEKEFKEIVKDVRSFYMKLFKVGIYILIINSEEERKNVEKIKAFFDELYQFCSYQKKGKYEAFLKEINIITIKLFNYWNRRGNQCP
ncbi:hypothetical protein [Bacillus wiedmannii]|uniref:hypothetical protein n=1 Tax=Bacillus wiedmannii TaxID=1890302 RepID=UPI0008646641|nr:hypothetical protein [Bacillus wiedmannii]SCN02055.1 Protein of unknown function [Bacillus wiedmannii]